MSFSVGSFCSSFVLVLDSLEMLLNVFALFYIYIYIFLHNLGPESNKISAEPTLDMRRKACRDI